MKIGAPVFAPLPPNVLSAPRLREVPNRVKIINSTFALNQGHTTLGYDGSQIYNSIIWKDDAASDTLTQIEVGTTLYDNGDDTAVGNNNLRNNAVFGLFGDDDGFGNQSLISNNKDVFFGPNFVDPMLGITTYSELSQRNFHINPSVRTMNMADTVLYKQHVFARQYPLVTQEKYFKRAIGLKHDAKSIGDDIDLSGKSRLHGESVERGPTSVRLFCSECFMFSLLCLPLCPVTALHGSNLSDKESYKML
ncbi:MAG: hypothetical protein IJ834_05980 [Paludibacteraceae bacterium]|nr:hypothetical protein [Paludibacteraceae bacterium]